MINFDAYATSGNPSSNLLDDYEEGTWTATFTGTSTTSTGYYTKIGSMVHIQVYSEALTMSSAVSAVIGGLPFTSGISGRYAAVAITHNNYAPGADNGYVDHLGVTNITPVVRDGIGAVQTPSSGTKYIMVCGTYMTNS